MPAFLRKIMIQHFGREEALLLWHDACTDPGCPDLCRIFCRNDDLNFTDVSKHLHFERSMTLGNGDDCCDFHFYPTSEKIKP